MAAVTAAPCCLLSAPPPAAHQAPAGSARPLPFCVRIVSPLVRSPKTARGPSIAAIFPPSRGARLRRKAARGAAEWPEGRKEWWVHTPRRERAEGQGTAPRARGAGPPPLCPIQGRGTAQPQAAIGACRGTKPPRRGRGRRTSRRFWKGARARAHARWLPRLSGARRGSGWAAAASAAGGFPSAGGACAPGPRQTAQGFARARDNPAVAGERDGRLEAAEQPLPHASRRRLRLIQ